MYYIYILKCSDQTLYTGITRDLERRVMEHNGSGLGARYTRSRRPVEIMYAKEYGSRSEALKAENLIKGLSRQQKLEMISRGYNC